MINKPTAGGVSCFKGCAQSGHQLLIFFRRSPDRYQFSARVNQLVESLSGSFSVVYLGLVK
jgi:hypothetical protein